MLLILPHSWAELGPFMDGLTLRDADALQQKVSTWYQHSFTPGRRRLVSDQVLEALLKEKTDNADDNSNNGRSNINYHQNTDPNPAPDHQHHYSLFWGEVEPSWDLLRLLLSLSE